MPDCSPDNAFPHQVDRDSFALLQHIHPNIYAWAEFDEELQQYLNGYFFQPEAGQPGILIDPPMFDEYLAEAMDGLGGVAGVWLSSNRQLDIAEPLAQVFKLPLVVADAEADFMPPGLRCLMLEHQSTAREAMLYWPEYGALFTGFTFQAPVYGSLALHPFEAYLNPAWVQQGLAPLRPLVDEAKSLLPSIGEPIIQHAGVTELLRNITGLQT